MKKTLIKTIEEFSVYVPVASGFSYENLGADILLVEDEQIRKYLGDDYYEQLLEKYDQGSLAALELKLLDYLQQAIANLAMESYLVLNQVQISDSGIHILSDSSTKTAFKWQVDDLRESLLKKGFNALEKALKFLAKNVAREEFTIWKEAGVLTTFRQHFINSAAEFSESYNIGDSWLTFIALLPVIRKVERDRIIPVLGEELAVQIQTEIETGQLSPDIIRLLRSSIRPALAHLVVAKALKEQGFQLSVNGGIELSLVLQNAESRESAADNLELLQLKISEAEQDGTRALAKMRDYLNRHASETKYATYYHSDLYVDPTAPKPVLNRKENKTYRFF